VVAASDANLLRAVADPLRLRMALLMIDEARTVKELAAELGVPATRLYYHVRILEENGLVEVTERRMVSGIEERRYRTIAERLNVSADVEPSDIEASGVLAALLGAVRAEMEVALYDGPDLPVGDPASALPILTLTDLLLTPDEMADVRERLVQIMVDYGGDRATAPPGARHYHFLFTGYPAPGARGAARDG
jgi:DNA-binding transcriptional ArsR family regulator